MIVVLPYADMPGGALPRLHRLDGPGEGDVARMCVPRVHGCLSQRELIDKRQTAGHARALPAAVTRFRQATSRAVTTGKSISVWTTSLR
jgi:hypothetical protein